MVLRPTVDPYPDTSDPVVADKRRVLGYGMEPASCPHVGEYIHLHWTKTRGATLVVLCITTLEKITLP